MANPRALDREGLLEEELSGLECQMAHLQDLYYEKAKNLQQLRSLKRQLEAYPLPEFRSLTWVGVCKAMGWPSKHLGGHRTVKGEDPSLHALLHLCYFDSFCPLDQASYAP